MYVLYSPTIDCPGTLHIYRVTTVSEWIYLVTGMLPRVGKSRPAVPGTPLKFRSFRRPLDLQRDKTFISIVLYKQIKQFV
jgi:hypothetical protein